MSKNCLKCAHFLRQVLYQYSKNGSVIDVQQVMKCTKMNMVIQPRNSEEKSNESYYIPSKCYQGKHFTEAIQPNFEKVVCRDV
jgi:hypothetical protein